MYYFDASELMFCASRVSIYFNKPTRSEFYQTASHAVNPNPE